MSDWPKFRVGDQIEYIDTTSDFNIWFQGTIMEHCVAWNSSADTYDHLYSVQNWSGHETVSRWENQLKFDSNELIVAYVDVLAAI